MLIIYYFIITFYYYSLFIKTYFSAYLNQNTATTGPMLIIGSPTASRMITMEVMPGPGTAGDPMESTVAIILYNVSKLLLNYDSYNST